MPAIPDRFKKGKSRPSGARNQPAVGATRKINMSENQVTITVELHPEVALQLAQFAKRSTFNTFYEFTEAHLPHDERQKRAYQMISGIEAIGAALAGTGYAPR